MSPEMLARLKAAEWRDEAERLRTIEATGQAATHEYLADQLDQLFSDHLDEALTLTEAAEESGYDPSHLGRLVRQGTIPNAGSEDAPRIRRRDLPRKPGCSWVEPEDADPGEDASRSNVAESVLQNHRETDDE